ncbi:DUF362 domain-containing protein [Tundrisphaera lichenicola]|uniref:DUF362 domain-containing protein n=1 Tax=Tundrisphaera lichenicola TaxID=2029860 RepID=UPI003EB6E86D
MTKPYPCGGFSRRKLLAAASMVPLLEGVQFVSAAEPLAAANPRVALDNTKLGIPGPYPGRVIEARHPGLIKDGVRDREAIKATVARGMKELTGADDSVEAWRSFFEPGDVVGIKVVPNGHPMAPTSPELVLEVIEGLKAAGVKTTDMFVYDRYKGEFMGPGYDKILPPEIRWGGLTPGGGSQTTLSWAESKNDPIAGYDPDEFVHMNLIDHGADPKDDRNFRSHLGLFITKRVNKLVMLPVLKDHGSAGVTGALKNISHGSVNNVARSHSTPSSNVCNQFIPEVVSHPILRKKVVLHIMDGIRGIYQKGPFGNNPEFAWDANTLFFATDPVAMDRVEWTIIDAKRKEKGLPAVAATGQAGIDPFGTEGFDIRQPQHITLAGNLGLGNYDFKSPRGRRFAIDHRVIPVT